MNVVPLVTTSPTEVLVWTRPSKSARLRSGPLGTTAARSSTARVPPSVQGSDAGSAPVTRYGDTGIGVLVYVPLSAAAAASIVARKAPSRPDGREQIAVASRGMASEPSAPGRVDKPELGDGEHIAERTREHLDRVRVAVGDVGSGAPAGGLPTDTNRATMSAPHSSARLFDAHLRVGATGGADG